MREEWVAQVIIVVTTRITPAHAGRILWTTNTGRKRKDHPRACGKNPLGVFFYSEHLGSPPRMREEFSPHLSFFPDSRITPAHAGRIDSAYCRINFIEDHPRACGKNLGRIPYIRKVGGSPPRMREEYSTAYTKGDNSGITPAHAGRI